MSGRDGGINPALFSSATAEWETPPDLFDRLDREFGFTLDVCATPANALCRRYYTADDDGLRQEWRGRCWMNPPYGRAIGKWVEKAFEAARTTAEIVVCLIPARTDTRWWHEWVLRAAEIRLIRGRLRFFEGGRPAAHSAPFPSAIVVFRRGDDGPPLLSAMGR